MDDLDTDIQNALKGITGVSATPAVPPSAPASSPVSQDAYDDLFQKYGKQYGIDPLFAKALAIRESRLDPTIPGPVIQFGPDKGKRAIGLMQLAPSTSAELGVTDPTDPEQNIKAGIQTLRTKLDIAAKNNAGLAPGQLYDKALDYYSGGAGGTYKSDIYNNFAKLGGNTASLPAPVPVSAPQPGPATTPSAQDQDLDTSIQADLKTIASAPDPFHQAPIANPPPVRSWGQTAEIGNQFLFGQLPRMMAGGIALTQGIGSGNLGSIPQKYTDYRNQIESDKAAFEKQNPGAELGSALLATPFQGAVLTGGEKLLGKLGTKFADELPTLGAALKPVGNFLMGAAGEGMTGAGGMLARGASRVAAGARQGAEAAALQSLSTTSEAPLANQLIAGATMGGGIAGSLGPVFDNIYKPFKAVVDTEVAKTAQRLAAMGVDVKGSQMASGAIKVPATQDQLDQFTGAAIKQINPGSTAERLTPDVLNAEATRIGQGLSALAPRTGINYDVQMENDLAALNTKVLHDLPVDSPDAKFLLKKINNIGDEAAMSGSVISGETYQALTKYDGQIGQLLKSPNSTYRQYGSELRNILDDALERSAAPQDVAAIKNLRKQWKNMLAVEPAADETTGIVNPQKLLTSVNKVYGGSKGDAAAYVPAGQNQLIDLARGGKALLPGVTGTGEVKQVAGGHGVSPKMLGAAAVGTGLVGGLMEHFGGHIAEMVGEHPFLAALGSIAGGGVPAAKKIAQAVANSPSYRNLLINRALGTKMPVGLLTRAVSSRSNMLIPFATRLEQPQDASPDGGQ